MLANGTIAKLFPNKILSTQVENEGNIYEKPYDPDARAFYTLFHFPETVCVSFF